MNVPKKQHASTREKWRELGFYYEIQEEQRQWLLVGSVEGLLKFHAILTHYANSEQYSRISSHEHYGPYMYLEIMTWDSPGMNEHSIYGRKEDIERLAEIFITKLSGTTTGDCFVIGRDYAPESDYSIFIKVKENDFDPSSLDISSLASE